jgi:methionyl-tRNA formyltransferase
MKQSPKVIFFGSGPVAADSLRLLLESGDFEVEAVVTKPNPPHHRGTAPVIELCEHKNVAYVTPDGKQALTELFKSKPFTSTVGIVIDYGIIIDQEVIDYFPFGIINSHFSLLPEWRGADPISFSILSGQKETGVSLMRIVARMDEGPILAQQRLIIQPKDTSISLTRKLIQLSHDMLSSHLPEYLNGTQALHEQQGEATYSRKLAKQDGIVDWTKPAAVLEREIRAYYEWPKSTAELAGHTFIIREAEVINTSGEPGTYSSDKKELVVFTGDGALSITRLQPVNKKEMPIQAFLAGYPL